MSLLLPLGLLQLQYLHPQYTTTTAPISHFVTQPHYVYHSPSVFTEHDLTPRQDVATLDLEGRYTSPRVFFDDDSLDESRQIRLEEQLREERLRQLQTPLGPPVREVRRYEKSVEGDLDYSEDKRIKLDRKRRDVDAAATTHAPSAKPNGAEGVEERRAFRPTYLSNSRVLGVHSGHQATPPLISSTRGGRGRRPQQQRPNPNTVLKGQGLYGAYKGTFGGQKRNPSGRDSRFRRIRNVDGVLDPAPRKSIGKVPEIHAVATRNVQNSVSHDVWFYLFITITCSPAGFSSEGVNFLLLSSEAQVAEPDRNE